ncbi:ParB/RepB/Spo0J family partition protein [bacterium]|nr:MAG: ParB/RepB/Spo0J family partition protein [bacterium]
MRKALGKGLSQLLGEQFDGTPVEATVESIVPNLRQPRTVFEDAPLKELAASIRQHGVLQPLVVRTVSEGKYELIAGERRLRAAKLAGLTTVPIHVRSADSLESLELALVENIQREDINAIEAARAYKRLIDEFGLTQEEVAERVRKARATVTNTLRLLKLPVEALEALENGAITEGHARALLAFPTVDKQIDILERIPGIRADPLRQQAGHVVRHIRIGQVGAEKGVADQDIEIERGGNLEGGGRIQHSAEDFLKVEDLAEGLRIVPEFGEERPLVARGEHGRHEVKIGAGEAITARWHPVTNHVP